MADTVTEAHQLLHPFLVARQCPAGARRSASSVARAFVVGSQPQPRGPGACRLPTGLASRWQAAGPARRMLVASAAQGVHSQRDCGTLVFEIPLLIDKGGSTMKIVVIGGTGLIGSKAVPILRQGGHEVVAGSPKSGINSITGEGLKEAMAGAQVVIDLANSPSFEDKAVLEFFETSGRNLLAVEVVAAVRHHDALPILAIVGTDRTPDNG